MKKWVLAAVFGQQKTAVVGVSSMVDPQALFRSLSSDSHATAHGGVVNQTFGRVVFTSCGTHHLSALYARLQQKWAECNTASVYDMYVEADLVPNQDWFCLKACVCHLCPIAMPAYEGLEKKWAYG